MGSRVTPPPTPGDMKRSCREKGGHANRCSVVGPRKAVVCMSFKKRRGRTATSLGSAGAAEQGRQDTKKTRKSKIGRQLGANCSQSGIL